MTLDLRKVNLVVATPVKSFGPVAHVKSFLHLMEKAFQNLGGISHITNSARTCAEARGHLVHNFIVERFGTHMLFVDSDIEYRPETVFEMLRLNLPVVTCAYAGHDSIAPGAYAFNVELLTQGEPQGLLTNGCLKIAASGLGFTLIKREALEEMTQAYVNSLAYDEIHPTDGNLITRTALFHEPLTESMAVGREGLRHWMGEDFTFFYRWRALGPGHDVWLYVDAPLRHHIQQAIYFNAMDRVADLLEWDKVVKNVLPPTRAWHPEVTGWSEDILPFYRLRVRNDLPEDAKCVEVGAYQGRSLLFLATDLARHGRLKAEVVGIDPGDGFKDPENGVEHPSSHETLLKNIDSLKEECGSVKVGVLKMKSLDAVSQFDDESIDMVFIDGEHTKEAVWRDLKAWYPKVKKGGIFAGHDFCPQFMGVVGAVNDKFGLDASLRVDGTVWWVRKR